MADLLSTYEIKGKTIKNRLVFPPCVCFNYSDETGHVTKRNIDHYKIMASGGTGLIVVEATCISPDAKLHGTQLGIWSDAHIDGLAKIASAIHEGGAVALIQIHHAGYKTAAGSTDEKNIFTASNYELPDGRTIRAAREEELEQVAVQFAAAAARAEKAGFDGIEIHGAHDYLLSQFLSADVNKRTDAYGENRALLALQVIEAIKKVVSKDFIVAMRFGASDDSMADGVKYAKIFEGAGVDLLNVSSGHTRVQPADMDNFGDYSWITQLGMNIKKHVQIPCVCVFGIQTPEAADEIVKKGLCDFAAAAKGLLSDPYWIRRYERKEPIVDCFKCKRCSFYSDGTHCPARKKLTIPE